ncbi:MAG: YncE family protein, partial [Myxococcota bacterium]
MRSERVPARAGLDEVRVSSGRNGVWPMLALCVAALAGCQSAEVTIAFPPPNAIIDVNEIVVRGRAESKVGVAAITVNGVPATTSNGFADWQAVVPLSPGDNDLIVTSEDSMGNSDATAAFVRVHVAGIVVEPSALVMSPAGDQAIVSDASQRALLAFDPDTAEPRVVSSDAVGTGPQFYAIIAMDVDWAGNRAVALSNGEEGDVLMSVDLTTGDRAIVAGGGVGSGPSLFGAVAVAVDPASNRAYLPDFFSQQLVAVDLSTGDRMNVAAIPAQPRSIILDAAGERVLIGSSADGSVTAVDLTSGAATVLSSPDVGSGPLLDMPIGLTLDAPGDRVYVIDNDTDQVLAIDLASGDRTVVSDAITGSGIARRDGEAIALDATRSRLLIGDSGVDGVLGIDLDDGDRALVVGALKGAGAELTSPFSRKDIAWDGLYQRALVLDGNAVVAIELASGDRQVLSDAETGTGPALSSTNAIAVDTANGRALVISDDEDLIAIDLITGERSLLATIGAPAVLGTDLTIDALNGRALFTRIDFLASKSGEGAVGAVDLASGAVSILSSDSVGSGPGLRATNTVAYDPSIDRVLVGDLYFVDEPNLPG